jgi:excisionase family DNA binding protein
VSDFGYTVPGVRERNVGQTDLIGTNTAAALLHVSQNRIRQLIVSGQLPAKRVGKTFVIRRRDIDAFGALPPGRPRHARRVR